MLLTLLAVVVGGAGTVAALALLRVIEPEKLAFWREKLKPIPRGLGRDPPLRQAHRALYQSHRGILDQSAHRSVARDVRAAGQGPRRRHP